MAFTIHSSHSSHSSRPINARPLPARYAFVAALPVRRSEGSRIGHVDAGVFRRRRIAVALGAVVMVWMAIRLLVVVWASVGSFAASADGVQVATIAPSTGVASPASSDTTMSAPLSVSDSVSDSLSDSMSTMVYVVQPGDTLWKIASTLHPEDDPRDVVADLRERTGGPVVHPGQRIDLSGL